MREEGDLVRFVIVVVVDRPRDDEVVVALRVLTYLFLVQHMEA